MSRRNSVSLGLSVFWNFLLLLKGSRYRILGCNILERIQPLTNHRPELLKAILGLDEQSGQLEMSTAPEPAEDLDDVGFQNVFAGLILAQRAKEDRFPKVVLSQAYVVEQINRIDRDVNGQVHYDLIVIV